MKYSVFENAGYEPLTTEQRLEFEAFFMHKSKEEVISELAKFSLNEKWYPDSESRIHELCPFCSYKCAVENKLWEDINCSDCICPSVICCNNAEGGIVSMIDHGYRNTIIEYLADNVLTTVRDLFKLFIKE